MVNYLFKYIFQYFSKVRGKLSVLFFNKDILTFFYVIYKFYVNKHIRFSYTWVCVYVCICVCVCVYVCVCVCACVCKITKSWQQCSLTVINGYNLLWSIQCIGTHTHTHTQPYASINTYKWSRGCTSIALGNATFYPQILSAGCFSQKFNLKFEIEAFAYSIFDVKYVFSNDVILIQVSYLHNESIMDNERR